MTRVKQFIWIVLLGCFILSAHAMAGVSQKKAIKIAKKRINTLTDQSYHYRVDYDTVFAIPVHSKVKWKNDFYLVYFLKNDYFEAEVEVDKKTGKAVLMALKKMAQPYYEKHTGTFNHKYFRPDSVIAYTALRHNVHADSVRMVYFGVIPKLGKRGTVWEIFSPDGVRYQSLNGASYTYQQIIKELNTSQRSAGNYTADEIRIDEINAEIARLNGLTDKEKKELNLTEKNFAKYMEKLKNEKKDILMRFTDLGKKDLKKPRKRKH